MTIKALSTATAGSVVSGDVFAGSETAAIPYADTVS